MTPVLIIGIDGLQPSQVTPDLMPNLSALAARGVSFANHHSVFPTVTRVNSASMVTGRQPGGHGLAANTLLVREYDPHRVIQALRPDLDRVMEATGRCAVGADAIRAARDGGVGVYIGELRQQRQRVRPEPTPGRWRRGDHPPGVHHPGKHGRGGGRALRRVATEAAAGPGANFARHEDLPQRGLLRQPA